MVSMEKVKPESRKPGRNETSMPIWYACTCEREPAEIQIPKNSAHQRKRQVETASTTKLPRNGTVKIVIATVTEMAESTSPTRKYASILPSTISAGRSGVESTCSMVPISHSRAIVSVVSCAARIIRIDRKSTRLNSSHLGISYAVFCLK